MQYLPREEGGVTVGTCQYICVKDGVAVGTYHQEKQRLERR